MPAAGFNFMKERVFQNVLARFPNISVRKPEIPGILFLSNVKARISAAFSTVSPFLAWFALIELICK